jgi:hypothetical protein
MSSERLRQAAQKIRETAIAAAECTTTTPTDPWRAQLGGDAYYEVMSTGDPLGLPVARKMNEEEALHVALWSPPVALAVADWLDQSADLETDLAPYLRRERPRATAGAHALADHVLSALTTTPVQ